MMNFIKEHKSLIVLIIIFISLLSFYLIREFIASRNVYNESYLNGEDYIMNPKTYNVNDYSPVNITDEQMATIYLTDFKYYLSTDINYAYTLLNEEYRNVKFGSVENFNNYVNNINFSDLVMKKYSVQSGENKIYTVYTNNDVKYIFKAKSVMEYEVFLDDYTVEI